MLIPFLTEPVYGSSSIWFDDTRCGIEVEISRKKYTTVNIDSSGYRTYDYDALFSGEGSPRTVVVMGTSPSWIPEALDFFAGRGIGVLLVSYQPPENAPVRGVLHIDYAAGIDTLMRHLISCGCHRTALYGCFANSSSDLIKRRIFAGYGSEIIENYAGLERCYEDFRPRVREFDSVLCVNDIAAASLINRLRADNIHVPDDLQVVCFGSSEISRLYRPSITSLTLDNVELGRQTVSIFAYLAKAGRNVSVSVRVGGELSARESTCPIKSDIPINADTAPRTEIPRRSDISVTADIPSDLRRCAGVSAASSFYDDREVRAFTTLEKLLVSCDELDRSILGSMLADATSERIAERLTTAPETVRYRLRRILQSAGMKSRGELLDYIRGNDFGEVLSGKM